METLAIVVAAMAAGAFIKGATGMGLPQIAIPVMAGFIGVEHAVVVMAIPGVVTNTWLLWTHRRSYAETRDLPTFLVVGTVGAVAGTVLLTSLDERILALALAAVVLAYVVTYLTSPDLALPPRIGRVAAPPVGLLAGALQGATGVSGPLVATYMHAYRLDKRAFVLSVTTIFQVFALVQTVTLAVLGRYTIELLGQSLLALVPILAVMPLGTRLAGKLSPRAFDLLVLAILLSSSAKLVFDALA